jgi:hypothetical protein
VKPSQKILARADEIATMPGVGADMRPSALMTALLEHLDEQHELERRRSHVRSALAIIGPGCSAQQVSAHMEKAGVGWPGVVMCTSYDEARELIIEAAEREGLL